MVLDFKEDRDIPILLGRPFLTTSRSTIDLNPKELTMKINREIKIFKCRDRLDGKEEQRERCHMLDMGECERHKKIPFMNKNTSIDPRKGIG